MSSAGIADGTRTRRHRRTMGLTGGIAVLVLLVLCSLAIGSRSIPLADTFAALWAFDPHNDLHLVIRESRLPRTIIALVAGMALGAAGAVMQAVTRNPLAEPGLLGINAGAAAAVIIGVSTLGLTAIMDYVWFAFAGAGLAGAGVFILGRAHDAGTNPVRLILAGAGLSVTLGSLTGIMILNTPPEIFDDFRNWLAGSVEGRGFDVAAVLALFSTIGLAAAFVIAGNLNTVALGNDLGRALGVSMRTTWVLACLSVMLLAGAATASVGPIGFVGLGAPHAARLVAGPDFRWILPFSALFAAILLLCADVLGRIIASPAEIAAGIIAMLLGGPFFVALVRRSRLARS